MEARKKKKKKVYTQSSLSVFIILGTAVLSSLHSGVVSFVKLTFYITPLSWLWLVGTMVQIIPGLHRITDMRQVHEYPDSSISKVLTVLKWQMIMTFNRKLLEKQRVQNHFASYEVHIGHFFYNVIATVSFGNCLTLSIFRFHHWTDRLTDD